jgi:dephospho-CoA kinase
LKKLNEKSRLHGATRPIWAITGGIATGKSTVSHLLKSKGLWVIDADQLVKSIYHEHDVVEWVKSHVPEAVEADGNTINFPILRQSFFAKLELKQTLEKIIYQRIPHHFVKQMELIPKSQKVIFYDVPLLFEKQLDGFVDMVVVVYCPNSLQLERLIKRDHLDATLAATILGHQMPIDEKKAKADIVIMNDQDPKKLAMEVNQFYLKYKDQL